MEWTPNTPHTIVPTLHHPPARSVTLLQLLSTRISQQCRFLNDLQWCEVAYANSLLPPVHILAADNGMFAGSRRDGDFDARVLLGEARELGTEERAGVAVSVAVVESEGEIENVLHASTTARPVAVVEVEALALEDEGAYAILC